MIFKQIMVKKMQKKNKIIQKIFVLLCHEIWYEQLKF
jgi:hypothetical protein